MYECFIFCIACSSLNLAAVTFKLADKEDKCNSPALLPSLHRLHSLVTTVISSNLMNTLYWLHFYDSWYHPCALLPRVHIVKRYFTLWVKQGTSLKCLDNDINRQSKAETSVFEGKGEYDRITQNNKNNFFDNITW